MVEALSTELKTYAANFETLIGANEGKFVVIHKDEILGTFDSQMDAIKWGYRELGNTPFLVKQVTKIEVPLSFVSNLLAV